MNGMLLLGIMIGAAGVVLSVCGVAYGVNRVLCQLEQQDPGLPWHDR